MKNNLRVVLAIKKKKVSDVSRATGISMPTLLGLYHERIKEPKVTTLMTIANYLGVSIDDLMNQGGTTMEHTLKELLAEVKSINEKLERIENSRKIVRISATTLDGKKEIGELVSKCLDKLDKVVKKDNQI